MTRDGAPTTLLDRASVLASFGLTEHIMRFTSIYSFSSTRPLGFLLDDFVAACSKSFEPPKVDRNRAVFADSVLVALEDPLLDASGEGKDHTHCRADEESRSKSARTKPRDLLLSVTYSLQEESMGKKLLQIFKDQVACN
ncbi:hypothetical protein EG68_11366 [Paragonimus skrjabini miyazakii]|uniref:Uncharacterized protein n=1 Tax=Paragonimus skrjabini miyazakii TaxID=59628 RepID=A0A8S9YAE1_9TREM|nr:hypothetical protein EG68_11366 [Paragonimus skrjabini miyazakii]